MNAIFTANNLLLTLPFRGCIWFSILFLVCFFGAHITKLAKEGWRARRKPTDAKPDETKKETPKPTTAQEPVYYIVEKKRRRPKQDYGEPKPIRFQ